MPLVGMLSGISIAQIGFYLALMLVLVVFVFLALWILRYNHKVLIIDKRGIAKSDMGRKMIEDGTPRLKVLRAKAKLSWPQSTLALSKKRNYIILVEDNSGQLHNVRMTWDAQALTTDGAFENVEDLYLDTNEIKEDEDLETDKYGYVSLKDLPLKNLYGKEIILRKSLLLQPADTNVMREFIQNNKDTIMTYYKPSKWEKMAPYMYMALVFTFGIVYWFMLSKWH